MNTIDDISTFTDQGKDLMNKATDKARAAAKQGRDMTDAALQQVRDTAVDVSDGILKYTKRNPGKALLIAATSGALLAALIVARTSSRD